MKIIEKALKEGRTTLSEYESKQVLAFYQIPVTREILVKDVKDLNKATQEIGYPLVIKGCSSMISHKTEKDLIKIDIRNNNEAGSAFEEIITSMDSADKAVLVQELVKGKRELVVGMTRDAQFGPCVMFGLGGIFTEVLKDICFRPAPLEKKDAIEMIQGIKAHKILEEVRRMPAADIDSLADILVQLSNIGIEHDEVNEIDLNPIILDGSRPVAVDALVVLKA